MIGTPRPAMVGVVVFCLLSFGPSVVAECVDGYASASSVAQGETIRFHVSSSSASCAYELHIYREGASARELVMTVPGLQATFHPCVNATGVPVENDEDALGCGWPLAYELAIPQSWASGMYVVDLVSDGDPPLGFSAYIFFVVKEDQPGSTADILFHLPTNTWQAYNPYDDWSLYTTPQAVKVTFDRPYKRCWDACYYRWERPLIRWMETEGYPVEYCASEDLHNDSTLLEQYNLVLSVGHDEYWSKEMRDQLDAFIDGGGNYAALSANTMYRQIRYEDGGRTLVGYKDHYRSDPMFGVNPLLVTQAFVNIGWPQNTTIGLHWTGWVNKPPGDPRAGRFTVYRSGHWLYAGTGLQDGDEFWYEPSLTVEVDGTGFVWQNGLPVVTGENGTPLDYQIVGLEESTKTYSTMGIFTHPGGGTVFNAATYGWPRGLSEEFNPDGYWTVGTITRNLLDTLSTGEPTPPSPTLSLVCPGSATWEATEPCSFAGDVGEAVVSDNCGGCTAPVVSNDAPDVFPLGQTLVTWTATGAAINQPSCVQEVLVVESQPPVIQLTGAMPLVVECGAPFVDPGATATDACAGDLSAALTVAPSVETGEVGIGSVLYSVQDPSGNTATAERLVEIVDTTAPVAECPLTLIVESFLPTGASVSYDAAATDGCDPSPALTYSIPPGSDFTIGEHEVRATATDDSGNASSCTFLVVVVGDGEAPDVDCPGELVFEATGSAGAAVSFNPSAIDAVDGEVAVDSTLVSGTVAAVGEHAVTWTAFDSVGNVASCTFTVRVVDTTVPTVLCPAELEVEATGPSGAVASYEVSANDLVDGAIVATTSVPSGSLFEVGEHEVTVSSTDGTGNLGSCTFLVRVVDNSGPAIQCPAIVVVEATGPHGVTTLPQLDASDVVDGVVLVELPAETAFGLGEHDLVARATDTAGNRTSCTFVLRVVDTTPPSLVCPTDVVEIPCESQISSVNLGSVVVDLVDPEPTLECVPALSAPFPAGVTTVTCMATDLAGNTATCSVEIEAACSRVLPGDCNGDGIADISDIICTLELLFDGNGELPCGVGTLTEPSNAQLLDANGDGGLDLSDPIYFLAFAFLGGEPHVLGAECIFLPRCPDACAF